jgi:hypothetical protein
VPSINRVPRKRVDGNGLEERENFAGQSITRMAKAGLNFSNDDREQLIAARPISAK